MLILVSLAIWLATWRLRAVAYNNMFRLRCAVDEFGGIDESKAHVVWNLPFQNAGNNTLIFSN